MSVCDYVRMVMHHVVCAKRRARSRGETIAAPIGQLSVPNLTTGTLTAGSYPELIAPTSVALHRVRTCDQRRRAWALAAHWTARLREWGEPSCVYAGARKVGTHQVGGGYSWDHFV